MADGLDGEIALVTGGTDGIGKAIARELVLRGAEVLIVGSDPEKGARAERELRASAGHHHVRFLQADLSLMRETDRWPTRSSPVFRNCTASCSARASCGAGGS
jgi:retinol dehydrogenase 12